MSYGKPFESQSSFFAHFMCFEVPALNPPGGVPNGKSASNVDDVDDDDLGIMDIDDNDSKTGIFHLLDPDFHHPQQPQCNLSSQIVIYSRFG